MSSRETSPVLGRARVGRYELPGKRWYFAACESCRWWEGMSWKHKEWAYEAAKAHNQAAHSDESSAPEE